MVSLNGFAQRPFLFKYGATDNGWAIQREIFNSTQLEKALIDARNWKLTHWSGIKGEILEVWKNEEKQIRADYAEWERTHGGNSQTSSTATQAQEILEQEEEIVAKNNEYTRNIGPRNGWDDSKAGTTIRVQSGGTSKPKPVPYKSVEKPSESKAQVYLATQEAILQQADKDISEFLRQHYEINDMYNSYGKFVLDKVCEYYQVNMLQLMTKNIDDDLLKTIVNTAHQMNDIANQKLNQYIDEWNQRRNVPTWNDFSQNRNTNQLLSVLTVMTAHNDGNLPEPIGSDATYYYYRLGYGEKIARVTKEGATVDVVSGDSWRISQSEQQFIKNGTQGNPLQFVADAFQTDVRSYHISEDGTGEESYWEDGKYKTYYINRPEVEFLDSKGTIRISNKFAETEVVPWDITPEIDYSLNLTGNIKDISVSSNPNEKTLSFSRKMVLPEHTYVQGEVETGPNGVTIKGEAGKQFGPLSAGAGAKVNYSKDEEGNLKQKYGLYGTASGEIPFASAQGNIGVEIEPGQHSQISQSALDAVPYLPSDLQQRIINDLFDDASKQIKVYEHNTKQVRDADGGKYTEYSYVSSSEKERIRQQQLNKIKSINIPDVSIRPSNIHLFEVSLIQMGNENAAIEEELKHE